MIYDFSERARIVDLHRFAILDTLPEPAFDDIARMAARLFRAPIALISYVDETRQWFKARCGLSETETPRSLAFCDHTIRSSAVLVVPDATLDARFAHNPLVTGAPHIRFYAGAPLITRNGNRLGSLCVIDNSPRTDFTAEDEVDLARLSGLVVDQMELRLANRTLREREQYLRALGDAIPGMIWTTRPDGRCDYVNQTWLKFKGSTLPRELGYGWMNGIHTDDLGRCTEAFHRKPDDRAPIEVEYRLRRHDGVYRWILDLGTPRFDADGTFQGYVGCCVDITERRELEALQRENEAQFRLLFENNPIPMWVYDAETLRFLEVNNAATHSYGFSRDQFLSMTIADIRPSADRARLRQYLVDAKDLLRHSGMWTHLRADKSEIMVDIVSHRLLFQGRQAALVAAIDVTERMKAELALREAKEQAEAASRSKSRFLACMSHELRTPLNAIIGFSDIMAKGLFGPHAVPGYADYSRDILFSGQHLLSLIDGILDVAKIEAGQIEAHEEVVQIADVAAEIARMITPQIEHHDLQLSIGDLTGAACVDPQHLRQMLLNLTGNAIKFTPPGGKITLSARSLGDKVAVSVSDTGIGISDADLPEVTKPFVQVGDVEHRQHGGAGLGLHLTKCLAEANGGHIEIASQERQGTTVTLYLRTP